MRSRTCARQRRESCPRWIFRRSFRRARAARTSEEMIVSLFDKFRYDGKRVLVVGGATGMGAAAAEVVRDAGAEVVVMDFAPVKLSGVKSMHVNLADKASIERAVDECGGTLHA